MRREQENLLVVLEEDVRACFPAGTYWGTCHDWFYTEVDKRGLRDGGGSVTYPLNRVTRQVEIHISGQPGLLNSLQAVIRERTQQHGKHRELPRSNDDSRERTEPWLRAGDADRKTSA